MSDKIEKIKSNFTKYWDKQELPLLIKRLARVDQKTKDQWRKDNNLVSDGSDRDILAFIRDSDINHHIKFLTDCSDEKLIEMATWNENVNSMLMLEHRHNIELSRTMKHRKPQLEDLKTKLGVK